jgi:RHS repeat-associated protein
VIFVWFSKIIKRRFGSLLVVVTALALMATGLAPAQATVRGPAHRAGSARPAPAHIAAAGSALAAMRAARRQHSRVQIASDQTAFSQTYANPDGTSTYVVSARPRSVRHGRSWVAASAALAKSAGGRWSPRAAEAGLSFSGGGNRQLANVSAAGRSMSVTWPAVLPVPHVTGATAVYQNVFPGVNLVLTADVEGTFAETLVVTSRAAARDPELRDLSLGVSVSKGLSLHVGKDGAVTVRTAKGKAVFFSPSPMAWDSAAGAGSRLGSTVMGAGREAHAAKVAASYKAGSVRMTVPASLLSGASTVFPVYIDPSYNVTQAWEGYGEIQSAYPTTNELNATYDGNVSVGYDGGGIDRGNYVFGLPAAADGSTTDVLSATLTAEAVITYVSGSQSHTVNAYYTSQYSSTSTWNSPPSQLAGPSAQTFTTTSTTPNQNVAWNVASWVQTDLDANGFQFSAELVNSNETSTNPFVEFAGNPTLSITYDHAPLGPSSLGMSPQNWASNGNQYTSSLTPTFTAGATDPDGDPVSYQFQVLQGTTVIASGSSSTVTSGTSASWTPSSALANDTAYTVKARGYDGTEYGPWTAAQAFTTDSGTPAAPTLSCSGYPSGQWTALISGGTTCTFSDSSPLIEGYAYGLQQGSGTAAWSWSTSSSVTINPTAAGEYTIYYNVTDDAGVSTSAAANYYFGVGSSGAVLSPADGSQTATSVTLQAAAPSGYTSATFEYRVGTTGSFQAIPNNVVVNSCGCNVTWPVSTSAGNVGVQTATLTWYVTRTLANDGPVQIETVFTNSSSGTITTPAVTVTLNRIGTGTDYGTTSAGPVTVGLQSGNAAVSATDADISSFGADLTVARTFNSLEPAQPGLFGWGWTSSLTGGVTSPWTQLTKSGSYAVIDSNDGSNETFTQGTTTGGVTSYTPQGDAVGSGLTLALTTASNTFTLTDSSGSVTTFKLTGSSTSTYVPATINEPGDTSSAGIIYDTNSADLTYGNPLLIVAPDAASSSPSTTACPYPASGSTWTAGCRGLAVTYNTTGNISQINFDYSDNSGSFHSVAVASYSYDASNELTAEWDPRLTTPLKATYTYDETSTDANYRRITQVSPAQQTGSGALEPWTLTYDITSGDANYGKLLKVAQTHSATYGGGTATTTIGYSVPLTTTGGGPVNMDATTVGTWGETDVPASAVAVFPATHVPSSPPTASDYQYAEIDYYDANGRQVNTASYINGAWAVSTTQYDTSGNDVSELTAANRATALAASNPLATASALSTVNIYACDNFGTVGPCTSSDQNYQVLTDTYGPAHTANVNGTVETVRTHTAQSYDSGAPNSDKNTVGGPYMLATSKTESASVGNTIPGGSTADSRTTSYTYANGSTSIGWTLGEPLTAVTDPGGLNIVSTTVYNTTASLYGGDNLPTDTDMPSNTGGGGAGDTRTVYYTAGTNPVLASCGNKPEWANLTCQTGPAAQPGTSGLPSLPVTTDTYDDYLNALTSTETFGSTGTRTITSTYDAAERPSTQTVTVSGSGMGSAVPKTQTVYSPASGLATDTQTLNSSGTVTADINTVYDDFGNIHAYTDASGNTTSFGYDIADRVTSWNDGKGSQSISYSGSFAAPNQITDTQAGTFSATYNPDGNLASETYPGGISGSYAYDATGSATSLSYSGTHWTSPLSDTTVPNVHGDWASQAIADTSQSLVASQAYTYDKADRLSNVQDTVNGQCGTRTYGYDADSNRTSAVTYAPNGDGTCQNTTGTTENNSYDSADRLTNAGYGYDTQGDITSTPAADAGGSNSLTATYFADDMLASQTQNGTTMNWALDPTEQRFASYGQGSLTYTNHYSDTGSDPSWVSGSDGSWTRDVTGFDGQLAAQVTSTGTTLELPDLHGDIMATATTSGTSTGPSATYVYNEFGTPETGTSGEYGWLGGAQISSHALGGQLLMGARAYNPATGRFSQTDPVPGGSANAYDYGAQNPVTNFDPTGQSIVGRCFGTGYRGYCAFVLDYYSSHALIHALSAIGESGDWCKTIGSKIPYIGSYLEIFCTIFGGSAKSVANYLYDRWKPCGINERTGLYIHISTWRYRYWWRGWHWSRRYPYNAWASCFEL